MHTAIAWFVRNPVAANLLMFILCVGGILSLLTVNQEEFPNMEVPVVSITVPYLGAAPEEVEQGVCIRVEEAVDGIEGIEEIHSVASEGSCQVMAELALNANDVVALNEIKSQVDGINSFPVETEKPIVSKFSIVRNVAQVALSGNADERILKDWGQRLRNEIAALDGISQVGIKYVRPYEISIEVSERALRRHGLTLDRVTQAVRNTSLDMPGGTIKSEGGEILIRSKGQAYWGWEFEDVVVLTRADGTKVTLDEVADIRDGFEEGDLYARFNGEPAVVIEIAQIGDEDIMQIAEDVKDYVEQARQRLPEGLSVAIWTDTSQELVERFSVLNTTAGGGLALVLIILALFLRLRLAMWVAAGIPIALLGCIATLPYIDINISTLTVIAFILVLGILVDDAIVVGERIHTQEQIGKPPTQAAIDGTWEVSVPVIFGVLTTVAAFPSPRARGRPHDRFLRQHRHHRHGRAGLQHHRVPAHPPRPLGPPQTQPVPKGIGALLERHSRPHGGRPRSAGCSPLPAAGAPGHRMALPHGRDWRGGADPGLGADRQRPRHLWLLSVHRRRPNIRPTGAAPRRCGGSNRQGGTSDRRRRSQAERGAHPSTRAEGSRHPPPVDQHWHRRKPRRPGAAPRPGRSHFAEVVIKLPPARQRDNLSAKDIAKRWRELTGPIPDAVKLSFNADSWSAGEPINYQISGPDVEQLRTAAAELRIELARYEGVNDISDSFRAGKQEIKLSLLPEARNLGLTLGDLARQVRSAFYGAEAQRVQRGEDDVRVMVRFPEAERKSIGNLEDMYIRTASGKEVPFYSVAEFDLGRGYSSIQRTNRQRVVNVTAEVDRSAVTPEDVMRSVNREVLPGLKAKFPDVKFGLAGEQEERLDAMGGLAQGALLSLILIYTLLAVPLKSYVQPLVIMSVIPFGAVGAIFGHWVMGVEMMFFSLLGMVALSGVVVNASLVLVDFVNRRRREGMPVEEALVTSCGTRFRAIILTSVTTFVGLIPLMSNMTPATMPFVPMAISLAYGVLFATFITLFYVPVLYRIVEDLFGWDPVAQGMQEVGEPAAQL